MKRILMKKILPDGPGRLQLQPVSRRQGIHPHHVHHFLQLGLLLQKPHHFPAVFHPSFIHLPAKPGAHVLRVQRIAGQPADGRKMPAVRQGGVQPPEYLHHPEGGLGHRLRQISAGRRYRSDHRQGSLPLFPSQSFHPARPLVKLRQAASQIGGISLLPGHFPQPSRHFPQSLRPPGGGIRHQGHRISHIPVIFRNGNTGIYGCLPGRHRHIRSIGDQYRPLHQRTPGGRVPKPRKFLQHIGHLIAPLPAADVNHQIRRRPFGQLVLNHRFSAAKRSGNRCRSSSGNGEKGINHPLSRHQRLRQRQLSRVRPGTAHRPPLKQRNFLLPVPRINHCGHILHPQVSPADLLHLAPDSPGNQNPVLHRRRLLHTAQKIPRFHRVSRLHRRDKLPLLLPVQRRNRHTPLQIISRSGP